MNTLNDRRLIIHSLSWFFYIILLLLLLSQRLSTADALLIISLNTLMQLFIFYSNYLIIVPLFYLKKKYFSYYGSALTLLILSSFITIIWINTQSRIFPFDPPPFNQGKFLSPSPNFERPNFGTFRAIPAIIMSILILLISTILRVSHHANIKEQEAIKLKSESSDAELKFLKSQINPHFLFNALNNIYSLSITQSEKAPSMLLKLSNMLRYLIYECQVDSVSLQKEVDYISSYIDLQKLKDEGMNNIVFNSQVENGKTIAPMLLVPFVENAFKHSKIQDLENGWIKIDLTCTKNGALSFSCENSLVTEAYVKDETGGIGVQNVRQRLALLYPDTHELNIIENKESNRFEVHLKLILA